MPHNTEVMGSNRSKCWAISLIPSPKGKGLLSEFLKGTKTFIFIFKQEETDKKEKTLIFVDKKAAADFLATFLSHAEFSATSSKSDSSSPDFGIPRIMTSLACLVLVVLGRALCVI